METDRSIEGAARERLAPLARKRREILTLPPERALDAILSFPQPPALVHSFSDMDLRLLIHDIGRSDALELLGLASTRQWEYVLDVEAWRKDRLDMGALTDWLSLMIEANPSQLIHWFKTGQTELMEYYLSRNISVAIRQHDQDPTELGDDLITFDDVFYIRFSGRKAEAGHAEAGQGEAEQGESLGDGEESGAGESAPRESGEASASPDADADIREAFIMRFLERLAEEDFEYFHRMMLEFSTFIPAEYEEEAFRMRNVRLAERGFAPFHEAVGVYQPLAEDAIAAGGEKWMQPEREDAPPGFHPPILLGGQMAGAATVFTEALETIGDPEALETLQSEFAGLSNQIAVADDRMIRSREDLAAVVRKACGYVGIGLQAAAPDGGGKAARRRGRLLRKYPLLRLFRVGYGKALALKWRARRWRESSWFAAAGLPLSFWDEAWMGVIGGLLLDRPLYFDNYQTGVIYREFADMADIAATGDALDQAMAVDGLLGRIDPPPPADPFLTWQNLLLTLWARAFLGLGPGEAELTMAELRRFFDQLWNKTGEGPSKIRPEMRDAFFRWAGVDGDAQASALDLLLDTVENEYGSVTAERLDARYIQLFRVGPKNEASAES